MKKISLIFFLLGFFSLTSEARKWNSYPAQKLTVKVGIVNPTMNVDISSTDNPGASPIHYRPYAPSKFTYGLAKGPYSAYVSMQGPQSQEIQDRYGKTSSSDWQFRFYGEKNTFEFFYQRYSGFYIANSEQISSVFNGSLYLQRPDLTTEFYGVQYFYNLSPEDYSLAAAFDQSAKQTQSGGSFFLHFAIGNHRITSDNSLVFPAVQAQYPEFSLVQKGEFRTFKTGLGAGYNLIFFKHCFASVFLTLAGGQQLQIYEILGQKRERWLPTYGSTTKASLGYNGETFFLALGFNSDSYEANFEGGKINFITNEASFFTGFRF